MNQQKSSRQPQPAYRHTHQRPRSVNDRLWRAIIPIHESQRRADCPHNRRANYPNGCGMTGVGVFAYGQPNQDSAREHARDPRRVVVWPGLRRLQLDEDHGGPLKTKSRSVGAAGRVAVEGCVRGACEPAMKRRTIGAGNDHPLVMQDVLDPAPFSVRDLRVCRRSLCRGLWGRLRPCSIRRRRRGLRKSAPGTLAHCRQRRQHDDEEHEGESNLFHACDRRQSEASVCGRSGHFRGCHSRWFLRACAWGYLLTPAEAGLS